MSGRRRRAGEGPGESLGEALPIERKLELYYWMRLTRTLEERLVALYRQTKVVGGLFRSLGQEADAVGSCYALESRDVMSPLIRNMGAMLVKGATPVEILKQYMAKGDSPTRGRELNIHYGDLERGFIGQISHLGDMVPVMAARKAVDSSCALSCPMPKVPMMSGSATLTMVELSTLAIVPSITVAVASQR